MISSAILASSRIVGEGGAMKQTLADPALTARHRTITEPKKRLMATPGKSRARDFGGSHSDCDARLRRLQAPFTSPLPRRASLQMIRDFSRATWYISKPTQRHDLQQRRTMSTTICKWPAFLVVLSALAHPAFGQNTPDTPTYRKLKEALDRVPAIDT